jgi:hypothetical protein
MRLNLLCSARNDYGSAGYGEDLIAPPQELL